MKLRELLSFHLSMTTQINIGSCSWKYDSWQGIIYPEKKPFNYLREYSRYYSTVEVDQWFWSLFAGDAVVLPKPAVVQEYAYSVPEGFTFCIKVPNSITLTHHYRKRKNDPLIPNPHFLSAELMQKFLERLEPLAAKLGPLVFQFEYLNKQKMAGGLQQFIDLFGKFAEQLPSSLEYGVEIRNPNFLQEPYFVFLAESALRHVFLQGYYMPPIFALYEKYREYIKDHTVVRLHGPDRKEIEIQTGKDWSQLIAPKDKDIQSLAGMVTDLQSREVDVSVYVNNHFEGSAPRTIARIKKALQKDP
jgi:uncharacterized protein YecE (DUF72 family)